MLHRLAELDELVRQAYADFDYKRIFAALNAFMTVDLSAFYFDIRKDALYCDPISSATRKACAHRDRSSVPLHRDLARADALPSPPRKPGWRATATKRHRCISKLLPGSAGGLARRRAGRKVAQGAARAPRRHRRAGDRARAEAHRLLAGSRIRSCMSPNPDLFAALADVDLAEICITSAATLVYGRGPGRRVPAAGSGGRRGGAQSRRRHQMRALMENLSTRSAPIRIIPDVSPRDAQALREWDTLRKAAE